MDGAKPPRRRPEKAETPQRAGEANYEAAFHAAAIPMAISRLRDAVLIEVNEAFCDQTTYARSEVLGRTAEELGVLGEPEQRRRAIEAVREHGVARDIEFTVRRRDGLARSTLLSASRIEVDGEPCLLTSVFDVTELRLAMTRERELEEQLRQAQKMEAIGRLAGGVAHDFNNLLTAISGFTELAAAEAEPGSELAGYLDEIKQSAERAGGLTRQLLAFGRRAVLQPQVLDVNGVVAQVAPMLERIIGEDIALEIHLGERVGRILADRGQIEQVIVNLAANARDAMPSGGKLTISTETVSVDEADAALHQGVVSGEHTRLSFTDTGAGMDAATMEHIFEPFFTTKMVGGGTGLGLSTVFGIVRQSGGLVNVRSAPGQGSTFLVDLPVTAEKAEPAGASTAVQWEPGCETVLVVEDEAAVLRFVSQLLTRHGYTVLSAASGDEAVSLAQGHAGPIDLIFCDLVMPGLSGRETASMVRAMRPDIRQLFSSGYSEDLARRGSVDELPFVAKPYDGDSLLRAIREALAAQ